MESRFYHWVTGKFPQNFFIKHPFVGSIISALFAFLFTMVYDPLDFHGTRIYTYPQLMALYCLTGGFSGFVFIKLIKLIPYFKNEQEWMFIKEFMAMIFILLGIGLGIFIIQYFIDPHIPQWTFSNLLSSVKNAYLIASLPLLFSLIINISHKTHHGSVRQKMSLPTAVEVAREKIQIESKLKKETLEFYPGQFLYAESDGNYVVFYLKQENEIRKKVIRNSISEVENQLSGQSHFFRTHRSFIVNLEKITGKEGNASGYRLYLEGLSTEIPVSRQNVTRFDKLFPRKA